jgi:hypothetical protein
VEWALRITQHSKKELPQRSGKPARAIFSVNRLYQGGGRWAVEGPQVDLAASGVWAETCHSVTEQLQAS